jgi:hypothetical protein
MNTLDFDGATWMRRGVWPMGIAERDCRRLVVTSKMAMWPGEPTTRRFFSGMAATAVGRCVAQARKRKHRLGRTGRCWGTGRGAAPTGDWQLVHPAPRAGVEQWTRGARSQRTRGSRSPRCRGDRAHVRTRAAGRPCQVRAHQASAKLQMRRDDDARIQAFLNFM